MASKRITELTAYTTVALTDPLVIVDEDDLTMASSGTDKQIPLGDLLTIVLGGTPPGGVGLPGQTFSTNGTVGHFTYYVEVADGAAPNATGTNAVVLNNHSSLASGDYSVAQNQGTVASGTNSHAEGHGSVASGTSSHAEGDGSVALGLGAHADGTSLALGDESHSESGGAAWADYSHAEGTAAWAGGIAAHAEGSASWAGPPPWPCTIATSGGVTVATVADTRAAKWFLGSDTAVLFRLTGGSGTSARQVAGTVNSVATSGGNTTVTFTANITDQTAGLIVQPGQATSGHAGGTNSFADLPCKWARGDGGFVNGLGYALPGGGQVSITPVSALTTDATPTLLLIGGGAKDVLSYPRAYYLTMPDGYTYGFEVKIVARQDGGSAHALFRRAGLIHNDGGAALVGSIQTDGSDINTPGWSVSISADATNDGLSVEVTGAASTTIYWFAEVRCWEVGLPSGTKPNRPMKNAFISNFAFYS